MLEHRDLRKRIIGLAIEVIPAGQKIDSLVGRRPAVILLIWRVAATPTLRVDLARSRHTNPTR
jgi:hypothetical protein